MKTLKSCITAYLCLFSVLIGRADEAKVFELVTDHTTLREGDQLIIASFDGSKAMGGPRSTNLNREAVAITLTDGKLIPPAEVSILTLGSLGKYWTLHDGKGFLWPKSKRYNQLTTTTNRRDGKLSITILPNGQAQIDFLPKTKTNNRYIGYNSSAELFSSYDNYKPIKLYRLHRPPVPIQISSIGYATLFYSTHALIVPIGVTAFTCRMRDSKIQPSHTYLSGETIPAGTAVIVRGTPGHHPFEISAQQGTPDPNNLLRGSDIDAQTIGPAGSRFYKLSLDDMQSPHSLGFYYGSAGGASFVSGAHKAYLVLPGSADAKPYHSIDLNISTHIRPTIQDAAPAAIFNLQGQRVTSPHRGIYIVNGKKVIIP